MTTPCSNCGGNVSRPGLSQVAWGGDFCSIQCHYTVSQEHAAERLEQRNAARAAAAREKATVAAFNKALADERANPCAHCGQGAVG